MAISLTEAQAFYNALKTAYANVITGKSFSLSFGGNTRMLTRQDIKILREEMQFWSSYISKISKGKKGINMKFGVPYDDF